MEPLVSILMPVYQADAWLGDAVASALRQTFEDFELVAVDDGSTDASGELLDEWAARDRRVRVIHAPHGGLPRAREISLESARGRFAAFLDADDMWLPHRLERQLPYADDDTIVFSDAYVRDEAGAAGGTYADRVPPPGVEWPARDLFTQLLRHGSFIPVPTVLAPAQLLRDGGSFMRAERAGHGSTGGSCDFEMWLALSLRGAKFHYVPEPLATYRARPGSLSTDTMKACVEALRIYNSLEPDASGENLEELRRARRRMLDYLAVVHRKNAWSWLARGDRSRARPELIRSLKTRPTALRGWLALALFYIPPIGRRVAAHRRPEGNARA